MEDGVCSPVSVTCAWVRETPIQSESNLSNAIGTAKHAGELETGSSDLVKRINRLSAPAHADIHARLALRNRKIPKVQHRRFCLHDEVSTGQMAITAPSSCVCNIYTLPV